MTRWTPISIYLTALAYTTGIVILSGTFAVQAWSEWPTIRRTGTLQPTPHESSPKHGAVKPAPRSHFEDCSPRVENAQAVSRDGQSGLAEVGSLQGEREASNRGQGRKLPPVLPTMKPAKVDTCARRGESERLSHPEHAYSSSVTGREWTPSRGTLRSDWDREPRLSKHGVRRVPARDVVLEVTETGRGPFLQAFRGGAAWKSDQIPSSRTFIPHGHTASAGHLGERDHPKASFQGQNRDHQVERTGLISSALIEDGSSNRVYIDTAATRSPSVGCLYLNGSPTIAAQHENVKALGVAVRDSRSESHTGKLCQNEQFREVTLLPSVHGGIISRHDRLDSQFKRFEVVRRGKDTQPSVETRGARSNPQVINPSLVVNGKYASWPSLASVRGHVGEPTRAQSTITGIKPGHHLETLAPWRPDLIAAHHLCGVDIPLLASLVGRESAWDPWALSKAGARGLTQVMPATAAQFAPGMNLWNPAENLIVGACWLRKLIDDYRGDVRTALHAYHAGGGTVRRKQVKQVTRDYANDVILGSAN